MKRYFSFLMLVALLSGSTVFNVVGGGLQAAEIDFKEKFSFGDRQQALKMLVPGTDDFYYYNCIHLQLQGQLDEAAEIINQWRLKRKTETAGASRCRRRNKLLRYTTQPQQTLEFLRKELSLRFFHARRAITSQGVRAAKGSSRLDQKLLDPDTRAKLRNNDRLGRFTAEGLYLLAEKDFSIKQLRYLLKRVKDPAFPGLTAKILKELNDRNSGRFGSLDAHRILTVAQLQELSRAKPALLSSHNFVMAWIKRLAPPAGIDVGQDSGARQKWLGRLENFTDLLPASFNSLKAQVLYSRLVHERARGNYDKVRFKKYLAWPCSGRPGILRKLIYKLPSGHNVDRGRQYVSLLPAIRSDRDLVRDYLENLLAKADDASEFSPFFERTYLQRIFAETKILSGQDKPEKWTALLSSQGIRRIRDRVELQFAPQNVTVLQSDQKVSLKLRLKNVQRMILRVHEINTKNFYRQNLRQVANNENLDGIVPAIEKIIDLGKNPYLRLEREVKLPKLVRPGVYVVELIGGGLKARAIIRKGVIYALASASSRGQVFNVFDGKGRAVKDAVLWFDGREFKASKSGLIRIPFSSSPGTRKFVVSSAGTSSLGSFYHQGETFSLECGFRLQRESLTIGSTGKVIIRPQLTVNGYPTSLSRIASDEANAPKLRVTMINADGSSSSLTLRRVRLSESSETVLEFPVRSEITSVSFRLSCRVKSGISNRYVDLGDSDYFRTSAQRSTAFTAFMHISHDADGYHLHLLGRNGEARPGVSINISLLDRFVTERVHTLLVTDAKGLVHLGSLKNVNTISAGTPLAPGFNTQLSADNTLLPRSLKLQAGLPSTLAWPLAYKSLAAPRLLALLGGSPATDLSGKLQLHPGHLQIGALTPGAYRLLLAPGRKAVEITVLGGGEQNEILVSQSMAVETPRRKSLYFTEVKLGKKDLLIKLNRGGEYVRVHLLASSFVPAYDSLARMAVSAAPDGLQMGLRSPRSSFLSGVQIDGEYRYILERRFARKFPGNMLLRPSLLLCPWDISESESNVSDIPLGGAAYSKGMGVGGGGRYHGAKRARRSYGGGTASRSAAPIDFLAGQSILIANLDPDKNGLLRVPIKALAGFGCIEVVAVDPENLVRQRVQLADARIATRDMRMRQRPDYQKHFTRHNLISVLAAGQKLNADDVRKLAVFSSIEDLWMLCGSLLPKAADRAKLAKFSFLLRWPTLKAERKNQLYSEFASHELNFWLYMKDRPYFDKIVKPHLANKIDKTFMDQWLLGQDLAGYLRPDRFGKLNAAERALLAGRVKDVASALRSEREGVSIIPIDYDRLDYLFKKALGALGLSPAGAPSPKSGKASHYPGPSLDRMADANKPATRNSMARESARKEMKSLQKMKKKKGKPSRKYFTDKAMSDIDGSDFKETLFRQVEKTRVWAESNWYRLRRQFESPNLVPTGRFWLEFSANNANIKKPVPFLSSYIAEAASSFSEVMLAMAVLDLPLKSKAALKEITGPAIVFARSEKEAAAPADNAALTIVQRYFDPSNRTEVIDGQRVEKYVSGRLLYRKVYGCVVTAMNATPRRFRTENLLELPAGAIPVSGSQYTQTLTGVLNPYSTARWTYYFYFPEAGDFKHYGAHLSNRKGLLMYSGNDKLKVVPEIEPAPTSSWLLVSQDGKADEVLAYMQKNNVRSLDLSLIAFRMQDKDFFAKAINLLRGRRVYHHTLWSYAVKHNDPAALKEYLSRSRLVRQLGTAFRSPLLDVDPVEQISWEHLEFSPLINSRAHPINGKRHLTSDRQKIQYLATLDYLAHCKRLSANERLVVVYHLLLQDRVEEALKQFAMIKGRQARGDIQYKYLDAYLAFYQDQVKRAAKIAAAYRNYPVPRWQQRFAQITSQAAEISGKAGSVVDEKDRLQQQTALAAAEPAFDFSVELGKVNINHNSLSSCQVNFYLVDLELLFSRKPFSYMDTSRLAAVRPTQVVMLKLKKKSGKTSLDIPKALRGKNLMVEVVAAGKRKAQASFSRSIRAALSENRGQLRVLRTSDGKALSRVYVKVYGSKGNSSRFIKDGYTDLRGRFEYATVSGLDINQFKKFAILVVAPDGSALVTEAKPPRD
jgi:hypothetical protein